MDTEKLTPTEDLVLDVLIARHRLGETRWTFESRHRRALRSLAARGLVNVDSGIVQRTVMASLTDAGRCEYLSGDYVPPIQAANCRSFWFGPATGGFRVDCELPRHETGDHEATWPGLDEPVTWTDTDVDQLVLDRLPVVPWWVFRDSGEVRAEAIQARTADDAERVLAAVHADAASWTRVPGPGVAGCWHDRPWPRHAFSKKLDAAAAENATTFRTSSEVLPAVG